MPDLHEQVHHRSMVAAAGHHLGAACNCRLNEMIVAKGTSVIQVAVPAYASWSLLPTSEMDG